MKAFLFAILAGLLFGLYNYSIKLSSSHINEILGAVVLQAVALILGLLALLYFKGAGLALEWNASGLKYAIAAGVLVGLAEIVSFYVFAQGIKVSVGVSVIVGVTVLSGVFLGVVFSKESLDLKQYLGVLFLLTGILLLSGKAG